MKEKQRGEKRGNDIQKNGESWRQWETNEKEKGMNGDGVRREGKKKEREELEERGNRRQDRRKEEQRKAD